VQFGCLLPFLIIFNLFFGWMFLRPLYWALLELGLILAFILTSVIIVKRITNFNIKQGLGNDHFRHKRRPREVIDVPGQEIKPKG
jgi:hypothetical protein